MRKLMLAMILLSSAIYCAAQKITFDTVYLRDGTEAEGELFRKTTNSITEKKKADSIARKKQWLADSVRLVNYKADSVTYTQRGILLGNRFADQLSVSQGQRDSLMQADIAVEKVKMNAKYMPDKAAMITELQLAERQRDIDYKMILTDEQFKKYLQIKRQLINHFYLQEAQTKKSTQ